MNLTLTLKSGAALTDPVLVRPDVATAKRKAYGGHQIREHERHVFLNDRAGNEARAAEVHCALVGSMLGVTRGGVEAWRSGASFIIRFLDFCLLVKAAPLVPVKAKFTVKNAV